MAMFSAENALASKLMRSIICGDSSRARALLATGVRAYEVLVLAVAIDKGWTKVFCQQGTSAWSAQCTQVTWIPEVLEGISLLAAGLI